MGGLCPQYVPDGQECKLPLAPGVFGGGDPFVITIEDAIPDIIKPFLKGTIRADHNVDMTTLLSMEVVVKMEVLSQSMFVAHVLLCLITPIPLEPHMSSK